MMHVARAAFPRDAAAGLIPDGAIEALIRAIRGNGQQVSGGHHSCYSADQLVAGRPWL
jgi:hypothetical protein